MGFIRRQEEKFAAKVLLWQYQRLGVSPPPKAELQKRAADIVDDAHRIAKERGSNVMAIVKELIADIRK